MAAWKMAVVGLESRDLALLETAIDLASGLETGCWELVNDQDDAQVILANLDASDGKNTLNAYDSDQINTLVVPYSSSTDIGSKADITLSYPLSYKNVTSLLKMLEMELVSAKTPKRRKPEKVESEKIEDIEKTTPPPVKKTLIPKVEINPVDIVKHKIDWLSDDSDEEEEIPFLSEVTSLTDHVATDNIETLVRKNEASNSSSSPNSETFTSDSRLFGLVLNIIESGKTAQIRHAKYPELRIFPDNGWFVFSEELDSYPGMFREPAESFSIEILEDEIKDELFNGRLPQSLWKLLYTAALFGSESRLLEHLDSEESFHLMHTPYFGMIPHTSDHIMIAEFMVDNNSDIETISNNTNIDIETVIDFCNACDAIQLLKSGEQLDEMNVDQTDFTKLENDTTIESEVIRDGEKTKKSGMINSLWSSLTKS